MSFHLEIDKFINNGRIDIRKEVLNIYIALNGSINETETAILKIADDYKYEEDGVYFEYIDALKELVG